MSNKIRSWSDLFPKESRNNGDEVSEWKSIMQDFLMKTEVFGPRALKSLKTDDSCKTSNPSLIMDLRHHQVTKLKHRDRPPKETIIKEARRMIRREKLERLAQERELFTVNNEIENLKNKIKKQRERHLCDVKIAKEGKLWERSEAYDECAEINSWLNSRLRAENNETTHSETHLNIRVKLTPKLESKTVDEFDVKQVNKQIDDIQEPNLETLNVLPVLKNKPVSPCTLSPKNKLEKQAKIVNLELMNHFLIKMERKNNFEVKLKYWCAWKRFVKDRQLSKENFSTNEKKIETFIMRLQQHKSFLSKNNNCLVKNVKVVDVRPILNKRSNTITILNIDRTKTLNEIRDNEIDLEKLEQIDNETQNSSKETYKQLTRNIREFDPLHRGKAKLLRTACNLSKNKLDKVETEIRKILPPPEVLLRMEKRTEERRKRWETIIERKRIIDEEREKQKQKKEEIRKEEEIKEKKRKFDEIKEKRRLEKEAAEERKREMEHIRKMMKISQNFYNTNLLKNYGLEPWKKLIVMKNKKIENADENYEKNLKRNVLREWSEYTNYQIYIKNIKVKHFYENLLKKYFFRTWVKYYEESIKNYQVAIDWYEIKLTEHVFKSWLNYCCKQQIRQLEMMTSAQLFHNRLLKRNYLEKWKYYPQIKRYEEEKEERKRVLRNKVQEILPDYRPNTFRAQD